MTKAAVSRETSKIAGGWRWGPGKLVGGGVKNSSAKGKSSIETLAAFHLQRFDSPADGRDAHLH